MSSSLKDIEEFFSVTEAGNLPRVKALLYSGQVKVNDFDPAHSQALLRAVWACNSDVAEFLIMNGADINDTTTTPYYSPFFASLDRPSPLTTLLLQHKARLEFGDVTKPQDPNTKVAINHFVGRLNSFNHRTPPTSYLLQLLNHGGVFDYREERYSFPVTRLLMLEKPRSKPTADIFSHILVTVAKIFCAITDEPDKDEKKLKELAARIGDLKNSNAIMAINSKRAEDGNTALHLAVIKNQEAVVKLLVDAKANVTMTNLQGKTALDIAIEQNKFHLIERLQKADADRITDEIAQQQRALLEQAAAKLKQ